MPGVRRWAERSESSWGCCSCSLGLGNQATHIDLAGDGGGNQKCPRVLETTDYNSEMINISLQELAKDPAALLHRVEAGERVLVLREGRAVAELRPITHSQSPSRPFGLAAGAFSVPDDFDAPLPDSLLQDFEG